MLDVNHDAMFVEGCRFERLECQLLQQADYFSMFLEALMRNPKQGPHDSLEFGRSSWAWL